MSNNVNNINIMKLVNSKNILMSLVLLYPIFTLFFYKGLFILVFIGVVYSIIKDFVNNSGRIRFITKPKVVYAFFVLPLLSIIWSKYKYETLFNGSIVLLNIGIFYLMMRTAILNNKDRFIISIVHVVPIVMATTFLIIYLKFGEVRTSSKMTDVVLKSISNEGPAMVIICLPYIYYSLEIYGIRILTLLSLISTFFVIFLSQSRGGIFMAIIMVPLLIYFYPGNIFVRTIKFIKIFFILIIFGIIVYFSINIEEKVEPILTRIKNSQLMSLSGIISPDRNMPDYGRSIIYSEGINAICEEPLFGIGYGTLLSYIEQKHGVGVGSVSHNIIITFWGEMGLPGVFVLFWIVVSLVKGLRRRKIYKIHLKEDRFIASATVCSLIISFIHAQFRPFYSNPMIPIILAQAYTYILYYKNYIAVKELYPCNEKLINETNNQIK